MTRNSNIFYFSFLLTILSCQNNSVDKKSVRSDATLTYTVTTVNEPKLQPPTILDEDLDADTVTTIKFNELVISIYRLVELDEEKRLSKVQKDTIYIICEIGETAIGQKIRILSSQLSDLKIDQRYETSVSISNEGPHCDLTDWKHYQSEWLELKSAGHNTYQIANYTDSEKERFPNIKISELKEQVRKQCGDEWFDLVKNINKPTEYPSWVGISKVYIRLTGSLNGNRITKLIILKETMGC